MRRTFAFLFVCLAVGSLIRVSNIQARELLLAKDADPESPLLTAQAAEVAYSVHDIGNLFIAVSNYGRWGYIGTWSYDYFTGEHLRRGNEYPKGSNIMQLRWAECWIGGVLGSDTLVSMADEFSPSTIFGDAMQKIDAGITLAPRFQLPVSYQDIIVQFTDTVVRRDILDYLRGTPHIPLNIEVSQKTYAWTQDLADDFILFDMSIKNIGTESIRDLYFGVQTRPSVIVDLIGEADDGSTWIRACIFGFIDEAPSHLGCDIDNTLKMMWAADWNGSPWEGEFIDQVIYDDDREMWCKSATSAHGVFFLDHPERNESRPAYVSYNWWFPGVGFPDFGPRHREDYRDFTTGGTGVPRGDANAYHVLSNGEIDYDVLRTGSIGFAHPEWLPPPQDLAGYVSRFGLGVCTNVLSVGPFNIPPGSSVNIPYVFVCAEDFHTDPWNAYNLPEETDRFYNNLNFYSLFENASWAEWVYDNPGFDTDGDGYAGDIAVCNGDTVYTTGDGIPDWRCAEPPPSPKVWLEPTLNGIRVRFNGTKSETEKDVFSGKVDFEGYRIYCGRDERSTSLALLTSYDKHDYNKFILTCIDADCTYRLLDVPFSLDSLRCLYGLGSDPCSDSTFDPLDYPSTSPYTHPEFPDSVFYFHPHDYNESSLNVPDHIRKIYPDEPAPSIYHPDSIPEEAYTPDGLLKYYEYQFEITNLLPTVPYWVSVTAFDFGDPVLEIKGLESSRTVGIKSAFPLMPSDAAAGGNSKVYVYPNPYLGDAGYREQGFEGRTEEDRPDYRVRAINFGNLPPKCTIYIFSLDGDLIRKLDHDIDPSDPTCTHHSWNMITRNTQMVASGLYYWVVEAEDGSTQIGKLVVIM